MGYRRNKVYVLSFDSPDYEGLEVRARGASIGAVTGAMAAAERLDRSNLTIADLASVTVLIRALAGCKQDCDLEHPELPDGQAHYLNRIISWNYEDDDGQEVPATFEGLIVQDLDFTVDLCMAWLDGVVNTPGPLDQTSSGGGQQVEESIPMEALSPALLS